MEGYPEQLPQPGGQKAEELSTGQWLWKTLKPAGCVLVLLLAAAFLLICFTSGRDPLPGYAPPESKEYYAGHPEELASELSENVLPRLSSEGAAFVSDGKVTVALLASEYPKARSAILHYFDRELLEFQRVD